MPSEPLFFAYDPRLLRNILFFTAALDVVLASWALSAAMATGAVEAWARLGAAGGLLAAFLYVLFRVRPRDGWGVKVDPLGITVSRPLSGEPMHLLWSQISDVRRQGARQEKLVLFTRPEGRLLLQRHLFPSAAVFDALVRSVEERVPPARGDA